MSKIQILTATYNHSSWLPNLYASLKAQTNKDFRWIIVDDGSRDETENNALSFIKDGEIDIKYIKKQNGGKSSAVNLGLDEISEDELVIIIDDDETLVTSAVEIAHKYYEKYYNTKVGIINFQRRNKADGTLFANYEPNEDMNKSYFEFFKQGYSMDGYIAYFGYAVKNHRFPLFEGEKYVGPSVLMMLCNQDYEAIWASETLGESEYMEGGITNTGRKLRVKNPCGMLYRCVLQQNKEFGIKNRLKYSMAGYAYKKISKKSKKDLLSAGININKLNSFMYLPGLLLAYKWKKNLK